MYAPEGPRAFDPIRRKWVALTPEEWVRQHLINHLLHDKGCPPGLIAVERGLSLNGRSKRADVVVFATAAGAPPLLLVECKAPGVRIDRPAFEQAARYNLVFQVPYLLVSNGLVHYACHVDHTTKHVDFLGELPAYPLMQAMPGG